MTDKNKYSRRAKNSERKLSELIKLFTLDLTANQIADLGKSFHSLKLILSLK